MQNRTNIPYLRIMNRGDGGFIYNINVLLSLESRVIIRKTNIIAVLFKQNMEIALIIF